MTWRNIARKHITKVIKENPDTEIRELERKIRAAYPFGESKYYPYKVWCQEVKSTMNTLRQGNKITTPDDVKNFWMK